MRLDEAGLFDETIAGNELDPKRLQYLEAKWEKQGITKSGIITEKGKELKRRIQNKDDDLEELLGHVCIVYFRNLRPKIGILERWGYSCYCIYTKKTTAGGYSWGSFDQDEVVYVLPHPKPAKLWRILNHLAWKRDGTKDRFHQKKRLSFLESSIECEEHCQCKKIY